MRTGTLLLFDFGRTGESGDQLAAILHSAFQSGFQLYHLRLEQVGVLLGRASGALVEILAPVLTFFIFASAPEAEIMQELLKPISESHGRRMAVVVGNVCSANQLNRAYELGVTDFWRPPLEPAQVISRTSALLRSTPEPCISGFRMRKAAAVAAFERSFLEALLRENGGYNKQAAQAAQLNRGTLWRLLKKHGLT